MHPYRWPLPSRSERRGPHLLGSGCINTISKRSKSGSDPAIIDPETTATVEIVRACQRAIGSIDGIKRNKEIGKRMGELIEIGDPFRGGRFAVKPTVDRPLPGIGFIGRALRQRSGPP